MPTSLVRPNGHRSLQTSSYAYPAVLAVMGCWASEIISWGTGTHNNLMDTPKRWQA